MPIKVNDIELLEGNPSLFVNNIEVQEVFVNYEKIWARKYKPEKPKNFIASDNLYGEVLCTWDSAGDVIWYQLFVDGIAVTPDDFPITSPYTYEMEGQASFFVRANNESGYTNSDNDVGIGLAADAGNVTIDYNSVSGANPETISGSNGSFTFTVPTAVESVTVCMIGGGGAGGAGLDYALVGSGGYAGTDITSIVAVIPESLVTVTVGAGGAEVDVFVPTTGLAGHTTSFAGLDAVGGAGGSSSGAGYNGNGGGQSTCFGTSSDGIYYAGFPFVRGGQGGIGNGGDGAIANHINGGAGGVGVGGGGTVTDAYRVSGGAGGHGRIMVTW